MSELAEKARETARRFRLGREAEGQSLFAGVLEGVTAIGGHPAIRALEPALLDMLNAQKRGDTLRLADVLEFVLAPALEKIPRV